MNQRFLSVLANHPTSFCRIKSDTSYPYPTTFICLSAVILSAFIFSNDVLYLSVVNLFFLRCVYTNMKLFVHVTLPLNPLPREGDLLSLCSDLLDFITFPTVVCAEDEADQRYDVRDLIDLRVMVHDVCCELREAGIAHDSHHKEGRTALCLVSEAHESERELCRVHDRHEERQVPMPEVPKSNP